MLQHTMVITLAIPCGMKSSLPQYYIFGSKVFKIHRVFLKCYHCTMNYFYQNCGITITPLFRLICVSITLLGRLYSFTRDPQDYERGKRLFEEVKSIAAEEHFKEMALSSSYRLVFNFFCREFIL